MEINNQNNDKKANQITIRIHSPKGTTSFNTSKNDKFSTVTDFICKSEGWNKNSIRCFLDGIRLQDDLTCLENSIENQDEIDLFEEMLGGKGSSEEEILKMLDEIDSGEEEDLEDPDDLTSENIKWYENLKLQFMSGNLKLSRAKSLDKKMLALLEKKQIHPYEIVRLRNVFGTVSQMLGKGRFKIILITRTKEHTK